MGVKEEILRHAADALKAQVDCGSDDEPAVIAKKMVDAVAKGGFAHGCCGLWGLVLSHDVPKGTGWVFSAKLPRSCRTTTKEWMALGMLAKHTGAPEDQMPPTIQTDVYATHYWRWT